jgi:hypothetical protein
MARVSGPPAIDTEHRYGRRHDDSFDVPLLGAAIGAVGAPTAALILGGQ